MKAPQLCASLGAALLATACAQAPTDPKVPAPPVVASVCNDTPAQFAVGQPVSAPLVEEVRQRSGSASARVRRPNQAVTLEYNAERVNVVVDDVNKVTAVRCG